MLDDLPPKIEDALMRFLTSMDKDPFSRDTHHYFRMLGNTLKIKTETKTKTKTAKITKQEWDLMTESEREKLLGDSTPD